MKLYKLGLYGTGNIARDVLPAIREQKDRLFVYGCASRSYAHAKKFSEKYNIGHCFKTYEDLISCEEIDVIYVSVPTEYHYEAVKMCLAHNKHVICEKPLTDSAVKAKELFEIAKSSELFLMDAMWSMFFPITKEFKKAIYQIGKLKRISADLGYPSLNNSSFILRDLEIYPVVYTLLGNIECEIKDISSKILTRNNIEIKSCGKYRLGNVKCKIRSSLIHRTAYLYYALGTKGCIICRKYWFGYPVVLWKYPFNFKIMKMQMKSGYVFEFQELVRCLDERTIESPLFPHNMTLQALWLQDKFRENR